MQTARAEMRKTTLLGLFFCVPLGYTLLARLLHRDADQGCVSSSWFVDNLNIATNTTAHTFKIMLQFGFIWSFTSFNNYNSHFLYLPTAHQFLNLLRTQAVAEEYVDVLCRVAIGRGHGFQVADVLVIRGYI